MSNTSYKVVAHYTKEGRHSPAFPTIPGWTFVGLNKAAPDGKKEATYTGEGGPASLSAVLETLHTFLTAEAERGTIRADFTVELFQYVAGEETSHTPPVPATPVKKKGWLSSLF